MDAFSWAVGVFEGEGCITLGGRQHKTATVYLGMTDQDVVEGVAKVLGMRPPYRQERSKGKFKDMWITKESGLKAIEIIERMYPYLHKRRRARADSVFALYTPKRLARCKRWKGRHNRHSEAEII